jgi:hypothetical protein
MPAKYKADRIRNISYSAKSGNLMMLIKVRKFIFFTKKYFLTPGTEKVCVDHIVIPYKKSSVVIPYEKIILVDIRRRTHKPRKI